MPTNEYMREYMARRYERRKQEAQEYLGGKCVDCGTTHDLQFHHVDPETKLFSVGRKLAGVSEKRLVAELDKCVLLCENCHRVEHSVKGQHGTLSTYRYCKCDVCREAWNKHAREYKREWRAKKRASLVST